MLRKEFGPFTADQDQAMTAFSAHVMQRIASSLARELKKPPELNDPDLVGAAVSSLIGVEQLQVASESKN